MFPRFQTLMAVLATCGLSAATAQPAGKTDPPNPLPKEIVEAWKEAGAQAGWMRADRFGLLEMLPQNKGRAGDLPAFKLAAWKDGLLAKLPVPASGFGLDLFGSQVKDSGLQDLAGLKSLQALNLRFNFISDAGLKELAELKNLQTLNLGFTLVGDAGMKELAGLKNLQSLELYKTVVTDAGLKELAELKNLQILDVSGTKVTDAGLK